MNALQRLADAIPLPILSDADAVQTARAIFDLEARYDLRLPEDFRKHLLRMGPGQTEIWDDEGTLWWPIGRVRNIPEEYEHDITLPAVASKADRYIFFADCLMWCWAWAICCSDDEDHGKVVLIGNSDRFVADSFTNFVERYLTDYSSVN